MITIYYYVMNIQVEETIVEYGDNYRIQESAVNFFTNRVANDWN